MDRSRAVILGLAGALLVLAVLLVLPFLEFFLLAILLAYPLRPLQVRLEAYVDQRISAVTLVLATTLIVLLPALFVLRVVVREVTGFVEQLRSGAITFTVLEAQIRDATGLEVDIQEQLLLLARGAEIGTVNGVISLFGTLTHLLIGVALTLFLLYYFLKDADPFNRWLRTTAPLPDHVFDALRTELDDVVWAVLVSHIFIAVVQGLVAGVGLVVLGIPNAIFWTVIMIILAVLPIIGSFLVWGPASIYLFTIGQPVAAVALFVYGAIVVSFCDDFLRPLIIERRTETRLNPAAIVLGVVGGIYLLGFIGVFFGPVLIGALRAVLDVYREEFVEDADVTAVDVEHVDIEDAEVEHVDIEDAEGEDTDREDAEGEDTDREDAEGEDADREGGGDAGNDGSDRSP
jgi:predicted PurR-regulated permease PerM